MITKRFYHDAGHGWLAVKRRELVELGLLDKVSTCSYARGATVYLEEDCDAGLYLKAMAAKGETVNVEEISHGDRSPIRSYAHYGG